MIFNGADVNGAEVFDRVDFETKIPRPAGPLPRR
jgi:hypothetical protein